MYILLAVACVGALAALVLGAPFVPTHVKGFAAVLREVGAREGDVFYDLGFGSGTVLVRAAKEGLVVRGFEINPLLWVVAKIRLHGTDNKLYLRPWQGADVSEADFVFIFTTTLHAKSRHFERLPRQATIISFGAKINVLEQTRKQRTMEAYTIYEPVVHERKKR